MKPKQAPKPLLDFSDLGMNRKEQWAEKRVKSQPPVGPRSVEQPWSPGVQVFTYLLGASQRLNSGCLDILREALAAQAHLFHQSL